jgi:cobalt-zinc-cadmium efflux system membrane fusion protein
MKKTPPIDNISPVAAPPDNSDTVSRTNGVPAGYEVGGQERSSAPSATSKKGSLLNVVITAIIVMVTLVVAYIVFGTPRSDAGASKADSPEKAGSDGIELTPDQRSNISIETVQKRMVAGEIRSPGKVAFNGNKISPVLPQFSGRLVRLLAEVGQNVSAGQVLGSIETPDIVQSQADYQQGLANERTAQTSLVNLTRARERAERLTKVEAIPLRELQQAQVDEKHGREDLDRARLSVAAAQSRLRSLHFSDAEVKALESPATALKREVRLLAPIAGTIIERKAGAGQVVQPGGDPLFQIADMSTVWVNIEVYEDQLSRLRLGLVATVETPAFANERFTARVDQIGNVVDPDKRTVAVRCVLPNGGGKLKPGMFVTVSLGGVSNQEAITVPSTSVVISGEKHIVFVETAPGRYQRREVVTGSEQEGSVVIRSGLKDGERVVVKGGLLIGAEGESDKN